MTDEEIRATAMEFARRNKNHLARELTDPVKYAPDTLPVSVFMAGSPGAGKTEFSKGLLSLLEKNEHRAVRIDGDEIRSHIPGYHGDNSHLFQGAISLIVEKAHDLVLHHRQSFILDGTLANKKKSYDNIRRSLEKNRIVFVFYVYQKPEIAWKFTEAREKLERRNIPKSAFIGQFFEARNTVDHIHAMYREKVDIFIVKKDFEKHTVEDIVEMEVGRRIDDYVRAEYTREELEKLL